MKSHHFLFFSLRILFYSQHPSKGSFHILVPQSIYEGAEGGSYNSVEACKALPLAMAIESVWLNVYG